MIKTFKDHAKYVSDYISICCHNDLELQQKLFTELVKAEKWNKISKNALDIAQKLNETNTIKDYIASGVGTRKWQDNKAALDKKLGIKTRFSMNIVTKARKKHKLKTATYKTKQMQVTKAVENKQGTQNNQSKRKKK
eukprot:328680_1